MTELKITEAGNVQFPMVRHAAEIGWTPLSPSGGGLENPPIRSNGGQECPPSFILLERSSILFRRSRIKRPKGALLFKPLLPQLRPSVVHQKRDHGWAWVNTDERRRGQSLIFDMSPC